MIRSSLPSRTFAGFAAAVLALIVMTIVSYRAQEIRSRNVHQMTSTLAASRHVDALLSILKDAETGQRGYLLTADERYLAPYENALTSLPIELLEARRSVADDPRQRDRLDAIEEASDDKLDELRQTIELVRQGRRDEALAVVRADRGKVTMDRIRALVGDLQASERAHLDRATDEWNDAVSLSSVVNWAGSGLLLVLVIAAAVMSSRDFRDQQAQTWLRAGQSKLADELQGEHDAAALGDRVLRFLAGYTGAEVGAVLAADRAGHLRRLAGFGLPADTAHADGAGLARQVARDRTLRHVRDVPADHVAVGTALGSSRPRELVLAPAAADGELFAVVELGFLQPVPAPVLELLRSAREPIGIAFRSERLRREVQDLLEETQRQAEELQTQQEELRVGNEELEQQTRALQATQGQLQNQQAELEQINAQLEEQMQAIGRQRDELAQAQGELQRANDYKSEFLANMSHELRTPLNSSLILAKLLMDNREGNLNDEQVKFASTIYSAGNDLLTLINDILDLSKIEAGKLDIRPEPVTLPRVADELRRTFEPIARERRLDLAIAVADAPPAMQTDPTRLLQILKNLLSNALKFTEQGGVAMTVRREGGDRLAFEVRDTGIGIAPAQQETIFEAFRQADGTTNRKYGGTGLGLSISRDLARLLGGRITVESEVGRGSTFTLHLPLTIEAPDGPAQRLAPIPRRPAPAAPPVRTAPAPAAPASAPIGDGRALLVIEDDLAFAAIMADLARERDFRPLVAHNAADGLALAARERPAAIVLDVGLPDRSGLSVLDALKHDAATRHIPVHMFSVDDHTQLALEMGATGYALKPVPREQIAAALSRLEAKLTQKLRRVLVVEDDPVHRESTCALLAGDAVETVAVGTAAEALAALAASTFDCMVLDLSLPDRSGFDLLEQMSQQEQHAFPPVIVYTGRSLSRDEEQRLRRYSHAIIIKGARSPERLLDEVTLFLHQVESELPPDRQRMLRDARHREAVFEGRRVLVVEDDVRNIFALTSVLEPKGAKVEIARNGREALDHLRDHPGVDLVLMDIMMPEMDGITATRAIRAQPALAKLPIIALTAKAMSDDRDNCLAAGANDYIAKPLDVDKLLSLVRVWMPK